MQRYKSLSLFVIFFIGIVCFWIIANRQIYRRPQGVIIHDINYYYSYLPAAFIEHDVTLRFLDDTTRKDLAGRYWHLDAPNGGRVFKMSMGMSFLYSPFFFAGHAYAHLRGKPTDGFSSPYQFFMSISGLCYMLLGLWFLRKILLMYFSEQVTSIVLLALGLGTNLYFYSVHEGPMSHAGNFFLFSLILYLTIQWHKAATWRRSILLGLSLGLVTLIRPTNILITLVPVVYNCYSIYSVRGKWQWMLTYYGKLICIGICFLLPWIPQLLYWKMVTGDWFYYSYGRESFYFARPYILETLFSFRKGLFIYTPVMLFAFAGLFLLRRRLPQFSSALWLFTALNIYVISSWWCWWYGGSFGMRAYIEMFALWSIPFAVLVEKILKYKFPARAVSLGIIAFFICFNIMQSRQYWNGCIHWDGMNYKLYKAELFRLGCAPDYDSLILPPDYEKAMNGEREYHWE